MTEKPRPFYPRRPGLLFERIRYRGDVFFFLSGAGQEGLIQVEMPNFGNSHAWRKTHTPTISSKINQSFMFFLLSPGWRPVPTG
jgi:hypothetical protein